MTHTHDYVLSKSTIEARRLRAADRRRARKKSEIAQLALLRRKKKKWRPIPSIT